MKMVKIARNVADVLTGGKNYKIKFISGVTDSYCTVFIENDLGKDFSLGFVGSAQVGDKSVSGLGEIVMVVDLPTAEQAASYSLEMGRKMHDDLTSRHLGDLVAIPDGRRFIGDAFIYSGQINCFNADSMRQLARDHVKQSIIDGLKPGGNIWAAVRDTSPSLHSMSTEQFDRLMDDINSSVCPAIHPLDDDTSDIEVLMQLRDILRVPEGDDITKHAKMVRTLADGLLNLSSQDSTIR